MPAKSKNKISLKKNLAYKASIKKDKSNTKSLPEGIVSTRGEVASKFSVSVRTIDYWIRDGMPVRHDGTYDIREIQDWKFKRSGKDEEDDNNKGQLELWQTHERKQKALKAEIELKKLKGDLISRTEVEDGLIAASTVIKRKLLDLPREIVPKLLGLNPKQMEMKLLERIKEIIQSFADETAFLVPRDNEKNIYETKNLD